MCIAFSPSFDDDEEEEEEEEDDEEEDGGIPLETRNFIPWNNRLFVTVPPAPGA